MLDNYGRPTGYGQISPYRDTPNMKQPPGQPGRPSNLERAISGQQLPNESKVPMVPPQAPPVPPVAQSPAYQNVGHDGVFNGQNRAQWRDAWMGHGNSLTPEQADQWLRANGAQEVNPGSGVWQTPHGETLDVQIARKAAMKNGGNITAGWGRLGGGGGSNQIGYGMSPQLQAAIEGANPFAGAKTSDDIRNQLMQAVMGGSPDLAPFLQQFGIK
jgi:hypothetical protein